MSGEKVKPTASSRTTTSDATQPRRRMAQNYLVIWVDGNIDENTKDCRNTLAQLRAAVSEVNVCATPEGCIEFLNELDDGKAFIISSGALGQHLVADIHGMAQVDAIYIFCGNKVRHEPWAKDWPKIRGVFTSIKPICESLKKVARECDHDSIPMSFVPKRTMEEGTTGSDQKNLDQLAPSYMYSVIFKDIVLEINDDDAKSIKALEIYCKQQNIPDAEINELKHKYHQKSPVWWYTREMFLYGMLNRGLRSLDMEAMSKLGFFIRSLHLQLALLHQEQSAEFEKSFTVYRGQGMSKEDFQNLLDSKGGLLSFNNFLSTSMEPKVGMRFVERAMKKNQDIVGVIFIMTIDQSKISTSNTPFAMIDEHSAVRGEKEILFTMHTVFRIVEMKQTAKNNLLWEVQLTITDDNDPQLSTLTNRIKEEVQGSNGWYQMGKLMLKVGHFDQAEELYQELLKNASTDSDRAFIYHMLGMLKNNQGKYPEAVRFYEKSLEIKRKTLPEDDASLANTYNNIGSVYDNMGEYLKALEFYQKARKIKEKSMSPDNPDLALIYNNIGGVYDNMGEYSKALAFYEKSLKIDEISLPPNHPSLATSYNNIGLVYNSMGEYSKALAFYEKALKIREISLPPTHPNLADSFNNIGGVYYSMGEYSKALAFYEKSHKIKEISLPPNHPSLATSYNNIGEVYRNMGKYSKALEFYEKSNKIWEISLPPNHSLLAISYNNIGLVYNNMSEYSKALSYLEKSLSIRQKSLPSTHPSIKKVMNSIAAVKKKL
ncbi:unnamed protein product [Rotaria magnacalcarata]|uniref:Kinesin light chain n=1 Tax=Rotaria magnacalcarata TaxID=392030 RepID=A0A816PEN7_9BILA|nr:unnamed protein product [Rotaria magnacalcarata]CAF4338369.1 unnamed protein product [Rotaria magnacalcarata]